MIHVDRKRVRRPTYLDGQEVLLAYEKAATFFSKSGKVRAQADFSVDPAFAAPPVLTALFALFGAVFHSIRIRPFLSITLLCSDQS